MFLKSTLNKTVLEVTLTRPEAHNALNAEIIAGLTKIFKAIVKETSVRAVFLRGEGPSFCAGGDLNWMRQSLKFTLTQNKTDTKKLSDMYEAIFQCPVPILGLAHGNVMGGGVGLAAVCDILAAETETKFCLSEVKLGLVPSIISPYVLRKIPEAEARMLMLTAEVFKSDRAVKMGLAQFNGKVSECEAFIAEKIGYITANAPEATRITKQLIQKIKTSGWPAARATTVNTIAQRRVSKEGQEGMSAFFEKRPPKWRQP